jgi:hypothetical protein
LLRGRRRLEEEPSCRHGWKWKSGTRTKEIASSVLLRCAEKRLLPGRRAWERCGSV